MPPEPSLETVEPGPWRGFPLLQVHSWGNPEGRRHPPRTTSCLSSRAPWSPHLYRVGVGAAECSKLQTCLPSCLRFSASARCAGQGGDHRRAWDANPTPVHGNVRAQEAGWTRDPDGERISPSFRWQISNFQGCIWTRGPQTLQGSPPGAPGTHISLESLELSGDKVGALGF